MSPKDISRAHYVIGLLHGLMETGAFAEMEKDKVISIKEALKDIATLAFAGAELCLEKKENVN